MRTTFFSVTVLLALTKVEAVPHNIHKIYDDKQPLTLAQGSSHIDSHSHAGQKQDVCGEMSAAQTSMIPGLGMLAMFANSGAGEVVPCG